MQVTWFILFLLTTFQVCAQDDMTLADEMADLDAMESSQTFLRSRDPETGVVAGKYSTQQDTAKLGLSYHFNPNATKFTEIQSFEGSYAYNFDTFWIEGFVSKTSAHFDQISQANTNFLTDSAELHQTVEDLLVFGLGVTFQNTWIRDLISSKNLFTSTSVFASYYSFNENLTETSFSGPGLKADFGIFQRMSKGLHLGGKMSYNLAHIKKPLEFEGQTSSERSLVLSWVSLAFDVSFYF